MIDTEKKAFSITLMCDVLDVSRSGYYLWKQGNKSARQCEYDRLIPVVKEAHRVSQGTYGSRRMAEEIAAQGTSCGRTKAATVMRLAQVAAKQKKKFKVTTDSKHNLPVAPNLLQRDFAVTEPDRCYVSDITYIWTREGWLYLAVVLDLFSRRVVGWSLQSRMDRCLILDAVRMAYWRRKPKKGLIFHSDRGSQYCSHEVQQLLISYGMISSMSRKGDCWDNAVAESFFGSLKTERVFCATYNTRKEAVNDIVDYLEMFYNSKRRHSYLKYLSPAAFEKTFQLKNAA